MSTHTEASQTPTATKPAWFGPAQSDMVHSLESYFQLLQKQIEVSQELAIGWVTTMSSALGQLPPLAMPPLAMPPLAMHSPGPPGGAAQAETIAPDTSSMSNGEGKADALHPDHAELAETGILGGLIELMVDADITATAR